MKTRLSVEGLGPCFEAEVRRNETVMELGVTSGEVLGAVVEPQCCGSGVR